MGVQKKGKREQKIKLNLWSDGWEEQNLDVEYKALKYGHNQVFRENVDRGTNWPVPFSYFNIYIFC